MADLRRNNTAYPYVSGVQIAQGIAGRNVRAAQVTNTVHRDWLASATQKGRAAATMERELEERLDLAGVPSGKAKATTTRSGVYLAIPYKSAAGVERNAHFSAHPVANPTMAPSAIGPFHSKSTTKGQPTYQARAVATFNRQSGMPEFGNDYVAVKGRVPAPPVTSTTPVVYEALGQAYSKGLQQHMAGPSQGQQFYRGYGGNKRRKTSKRKHSRKRYTRRR